MLEDLDVVFRNLGRYPVNNDVKVAFSRVVSHCELRADGAQKRSLEAFESFGKIVLLQDRPAKPFFHRRFARAAMDLSRAFEATAA